MTKAEELALEISYATSDVDISYEDWLLKLEKLLEAREKEMVERLELLKTHIQNHYQSGALGIMSTNNDLQDLSRKACEEIDMIID